jgi:hypothetical protein
VEGSRTARALSVARRRQALESTFGTTCADWGYVFAGADSKATIRFDATVNENSRYALGLAWERHENRGKSVAVTVTSPAGSETKRLNMSQAIAGKATFHPMGEFDFKKGETCSVLLTTKGAKGNVHADAIQLLKVK